MNYSELLQLAKGWGNFVSDRINILRLLKNYEPYELVHFSGNTYTTRTHDSLKISNGKLQIVGLNGHLCHIRRTV